MTDVVRKIVEKLKLASHPEGGYFKEVYRSEELIPKVGLENKYSYALVGCTVAPGFDFADFELAMQKDLCNRFPQHEDLIKRFTAK
jgi:predicted cupin superfamily sugar epimerase